MALADNSYGSVAEVEALTRVYMAGELGFNGETHPTLTEVEKFIDRCSGVLNLALANAGFTIPVVQADAALACDNWVVTMAAEYVEVSQPYAGLEENPRSGVFARLEEKATLFVQMNQAGFGALGVGQATPDSNAIVFTGEQVQSERADPTNSSLEQPKFRRGQFDS